MAKVQEWNEQEFAAAISQGTAVADFYAVWCGPCKMMMGVLEKAAAEFSDDEIKVGKINIDSCRELAAKYNIRTIPTFMIFKNNEVKSVHIGVQGQQQLVRAIRNVLAE